MSSGRIWPYAIGASIVMVFGFCVATIVVTQNVNIQESDAYMSKYQEADLNANELIFAKQAFDKQYSIEYINDAPVKSGVDVRYKVTDVNLKAVNDAELTLALSRPETKEFNQQLATPKVKNGIYTFSGLKFPKEGVWNLIVKVKIGDDYKFYHVKTDTRNASSYEY